MVGKRNKGRGENWPIKPWVGVIFDKERSNLKYVRR